MSLDDAVRAPSLMIIDDDEISLSLISLLLKSEGYSVSRASSGEAALDLLASLATHAHPSALLIDLHMPGLSGHALAARLRHAVPNAKLLAMSATPGAAAGYDGFLKKPLDPIALKALLNGHGIGEDQPHDPNQDQPALDEAVYRKMSRMMPPSALREVYEACIEDVRAREPEMRAAAIVGDLSSVRFLAHTLKGSTGMLGAKKLAAFAAALELHESTPEQVFSLIDNLLPSCDELHRILLAKLP
jgi:CheY-like chemotaxis protein